MKLGMLCVSIVIGFASVLGAQPAPSTQGAFAVELAAKLGFGDGSRLGQAEAIELLSRGGIRPDAGWYPEGPATELFVVQIQKSIHMLLDNVSRRLAIPVPPTLSLAVVSTEPFGGQTIFYDPQDFQAIALPSSDETSPSAGPEPGHPASAEKAKPKPKH